MSSRFEQRDIWLTVCSEFIHHEFNGQIPVKREPGHAYLLAWPVMPAEGEGEHVISYNVVDDEWADMEDRDSFVHVVSDGKVFIGYPLQEPEDSGMYFKVEHPREAAELMHLLAHPKTCTIPLPAEEEPWLALRLGNLFAVKILIPCGKSWKTIDPMTLPAGEPDDFRRLLLVNIVRHWDSFTMGDAIQAGTFAERWPEYVGNLPDAAQDLRAGYIMDFEGNLRSAVDFLLNEPVPDNLFLDLLLVPRKADVSYLYLRELLSGDKRTREALKQALHLPETLELLGERFSGIEVSLPSRYYHQIRQVAEHLGVRELLCHTAEAVATQPGDFRTVVERNREIACALHRIRVSPDARLKVEPRDADLGRNAGNP